MLTGLKPVVAEVGKTGSLDLYVRAGDPIGVKHLCQAGVFAIFGGISIKPIEIIRVEVKGTELR